MGKLLLVTGKLAEQGVREAARSLDADVLVLPVSVAQFMGPKMAADEIGKLDADYDRIILPGLVRFDAAEVEKEVKMPCFKGPMHASDLVEVVQKGLKLSKKEPADSLLEKSGEEEFRRAAAEAEKGKEDFRIGDLKIGKGFPPRIIAEIVDAPLLTDEESLERAQYYLRSGADIIDVGAIAAEDNSERLAEIISFLKNKLKVPLSIDSLNPEEINAGTRAGADLVLSLSGDNLGEVDVGKAAYVVVPLGGSLEDNMNRAQGRGFKKLIADPILAPPFKTVESLSQYHAFKGKAPIMMGIGNIVELIDADSVGMNGLLAAAAVELGASLLLTTENSQKTRNSVRELRRGVEMAFLARAKGSLPKDLGFGLLLAKGKGKGLEAKLKDAKIIQVPDEMPKFKADPKGYFNIFIDPDKERIVAAHSKNGYDRVFEGRNAESLSKRIIEEGLISSQEHAAYLGRELQKAEIYLRLKRGYVQDEDFSGL